MKHLNNYIIEALVKNHISEYRYVDLGLPSGNLWATCNLGANRPEEYGGYYMWGNTKPLNGTYPNWDLWNELNLRYYHKGDILALNDDAACANSNGKCVMPTVEDAMELIKNTVLKLISINGIECVDFISTHDKTQHIIIPCAGYYTQNGDKEINRNGAIWTSTVDNDDDKCANVLIAHHGNGSIKCDFKYTGRSVRAIIKKMKG